MSAVRPAAPPVFRVGDWLVRARECVLERAGNRLHAEPRVMDVLVVLSERQGEVVSAEELLLEVWRGTFYGDNPVHKTISELRRLLGDSANKPRYIKTIRKRGYQIIAPVNLHEPGEPMPRHTRPEWEQGSPFRGLEPFETLHAPVYFGRSRAVSALLDAIRGQLSGYRPFVLIVGPSASGKSSLVNAGLTPLLLEAAEIAPARAWSVARLDLGRLVDANLARQLTDVFESWLSHADYKACRAQAAYLVEQLRKGESEEVVSALDKLGTDMHAAHGNDPAGRFFLVIDHLEAATAEATNVQARDLLVHSLEALTRSATTFALGCCRSDCYPALLERLPGLVEMKAGHGHFDLPAPSPGEISQMIRRPAFAAGCSFDVDPVTQERLDDRLRDATVNSPDALSLLQHTLQMLYAERTDRGLLTFAAYRDLGGLEGALARHAEAVFSRLESPVRHALDHILERLVRLDTTGNSILARPLLRNALTTTDECRLVDAFVEDRLFVATLSADGPAITVAHEALIRHWPRARAWVEENRRRLQARARLAENTHRWLAERRNPDLLLNRGLPLEESLDLYEHSGWTLESPEREYVQYSLRRQTRHSRLRHGAVIMLLIFAVAATFMGIRADRLADVMARERDQSEALVAFILDDLVNELRPLGRLDLLDRVARFTLDQLSTRHSDSGSDQRLINKSRSLLTIGEVYANQAEWQSAETALLQANASLEDALRRGDRRAQILDELGQCAYWLGYISFQKNELGEARKWWRQYADHTRALVDIQPREHGWLLEHSYALNNLGSLAQARGRTATALRYFRQSAELKHRALARGAPAREVALELADTLSWIGSANESLGQLREAVDSYHESLHQTIDYADRFGITPEVQHREALARMRVAMLGHATGRGQAENHAYRAQELLRVLTEQDPSNVSWQQDLASALVTLGDIQASASSIDAAHDSYMDALTILERLLERDTGVPEWLRMRGVLRARLSDILLARGENDAAIVMATSALDTLYPLMSDHPGDRLLTADYARALLAAGRSHHHAGNHAAADRQWALAAATLAPLAVDTRDHRILGPWAQALIYQDRERAAVDMLTLFDDIGLRAYPPYDRPLVMTTTEEN